MAYAFEVSMERNCSNCLRWTGNADAEEAKCNLLGVNTRRGGCCPGCRTPETTDEEYAEAQREAAEIRRRLLGTPSAPAPVKRPPVHSVVKPRRKKRRPEPVMIKYDPSRPKLEPLAHQLEALNRYRDADVIPLFFEMGCGKSFTTLAIAEDKFKRGLIEGLLVVAPNDVHRQWFDELVNGVDKNHDGVMWQELGVDFEAQCVGGAWGQEELYPFAFEGEHVFKFVSVNVDTFSTPHKWESIVEWANSDNYMIAIDEATVIKNKDSQRSKRLLYKFNEVTWKGKTPVVSVKKHPVRAVLTGTPVTNGPVDLWAIMEFVQPNFFGRNYYSFKSYYSMLCKLSAILSEEEAKRLSPAQLNATVNVTQNLWQKIKDCPSYEEAFILFGCDKDTYLTIKHQDHFSGAYKHADELKAKLDKVAMFKRLIDCVDMPPVEYVLREVRMSEAQTRVYKDMKKTLRAEFSGHATDAKNKIVAVLRLQQISSGFIVGRQTDDFNYNDEEEYDLTPEEVVWLDEKNPRMEALLRDVDECDKPLLILTRFSAEAAKIYDLLKDKYSTGLFTGWRVVGSIDDFKEGKLDILVANSAKISRGFNLQVAHTTLFYSNTFSMEVRQQAEFRTFRMGQKHPCLYIDYSCSAVDVMIRESLATKKNLLEYVRGDSFKELLEE